MKIINCNSKNYLIKINKLLEKRRSGKDIDTSIVPKILREIKKDGIKALRKYEKKYSNNSKIFPTKKEINAAINSLNPDVKKAIDFSYNRIKKFHELQKTKDIKYIDKYKNRIEYKSIPINKVGCYVPKNLPSSLLFQAIPAKIANVKNIIVANPRVEGKLNAAVAYAAKKCGVTKIINCGGAQAIGYLAYVEKTNKITGPGNAYVTKSKKLVSGSVGVESMVAGASEICIIADNKTDLDAITWSLISQAEHGPDSECVLITKYKNIIDKVIKKIKKDIKTIPTKDVAIKSLKKYGKIILCKNDKQIINVCNELAPEHLEVNVKNYKKYISKISNAGSICIGRYTPMSVSDFSVGTTHLLPCYGSSKFASGLNINEYLKKVSHINLSKLGIEIIGKSARYIANEEKMWAHSMSIKSRMRR
jgi:histidinol dehydrogenase|tara:strand:+ start:402 stop:1661 length:1260 start_codon:yes stop_codon:yes gene_type:complete